MVVVGVALAVPAIRGLGGAESAPRPTPALEKVRKPSSGRVGAIGEAIPRRALPPFRGPTVASVRSRHIRQVPLRADPAVPTGLKVLRAAARGAAGVTEAPESRLIPRITDQPVNGGGRENSFAAATEEPAEGPALKHIATAAEAVIVQWPRLVTQALVARPPPRLRPR